MCIAVTDQQGATLLVQFYSTLNWFDTASNPDRWSEKQWPPTTVQYSDIHVHPTDTTHLPLQTPHPTSNGNFHTQMTLAAQQHNGCCHTEIQMQIWWSHMGQTKKNRMQEECCCHKGVGVGGYLVWNNIWVGFMAWRTTAWSSGPWVSLDNTVL